MIRHLTYAGLGLVLAAVAHADPGPGSTDTSEEPVRDETAAGLDAFVETAIRGGLLVPNADRDSATAPAMMLQPGFACGPDYPLDFSVVSSLRSFTELQNGTTSVDAAEAEAALLNELKSKLALGLYSEAKAMIATAEGEQWVPYRQFADLMIGRAAPDVAYFQALANCHLEADFWLAVAQLAAFETEGVERFETKIATVRALPHNLRQDVATLVVPTLILQRRKDVAQQTVATFSAEEIENSTELTALKTAIADMPDGSESDDRLVMLMSRPTLKLAALLILIERGDTLRPTLKEFAIEEAWNILEENEPQPGFDRILAFVVGNLESENLYSGLERVRTLPIAQTEEVRAAVDQSIISSLSDYLASSEPADSLKGLKTLSQFHASLPYNAEGNALRVRGAEIALDLGLLSLVDALLESVERDADVAHLLAQAAFWGGADDQLFALRAAFPGMTEINRLAGIRAVQGGQADIADMAYAKLVGQPTAQLELIEQGALVDNWALFNANVGTLTGELSLEDGLRLERVRRIHRASAANGPRQSQTLRPYQITPLLEASKLALSSSQAGASYE